MKKVGWFLGVVLALGGCDDSPASSTSASGSGTDTGASTGGGGGDTTGFVGSTTASANECEDDYHGNNSLTSILDLNMDTTTTTSIVLGDGVVSSGVEQGGDSLVVCPNEGDYFSFDLACDSYVSVEVRRIDGGEFEAPPELYLYEVATIDLSNPEPTDSSEGQFEKADLFLRPVQQKLNAGEHVVRVRPFVEYKRAYSLTVTVLPTQTGCS